MRTTLKMAVGGFVLCALFGTVVWAQPMLPGGKKVPGEMWRNSMSMEMQGMTMPMPGGNRETCVPVGRAQEAMAAPDKDCQVYDTQASGNKFSGKFRCTGQQKMEGSMESVSEGNRIRGTMRARSPDGNEFTMKFDNTRIGTACEAIDNSGYKPPPPPQYATVDPCKQAAEGMAFVYFIGRDAMCAKTPHLKTFCANVKTPAGFLGLDMEQRKYARADLSSYGSTIDTSVYTATVTKSLEACGFDKSPAGVTALKSSLLKTAVAEDNWEYILIYADEDSGGGAGGAGSAGGGAGGGGAGGTGGAGGLLGGIAGSAQQNCSGRSYSSMSMGSKTPKYAQACRDYGFTLTQGDYQGARAAAYRKFNVEYASSGGVAASRSSAAGTPAAGASPAGSAPEGAQPPADPNAKPAATDVAKEALEKGKNVLRGIFGR